MMMREFLEGQVDQLCEQLSAKDVEPVDCQRNHPKGIK
jgi:hypothetical protein